MRWEEEDVEKVKPDIQCKVVTEKGEKWRGVHMVLRKAGLES